MHRHIYRAPYRGATEHWKVGVGRKAGSGGFSDQFSVSLMPKAPHYNTHPTTNQKTPNGILATLFLLIVMPTHPN